MPKTEQYHTSPLLSIETEYWEQGLSNIVGIDEAGRGPLAGPVVAAACLIPQGIYFSGIDDSKRLTSLQRESLFQEITQHPSVVYGIGLADSLLIDQINILQATFVAMRQAVEGVAERFSVLDILLVDGHLLPSWPWRSKAIVGGDALSQSIAAASILAKVTRDRLMEEFHIQWPQYGFHRHKGYGTKKHRQALEEFGPCPIHRITFEPIKSLRLVT